MHTFTHMLASLLVLIGLSGKALAQSTFDANGDGTADSVAFIGDTIEVRSGVDSSLLYSIAGTSGEGFGASYLLNRDLDGDGTLDFAVAAPNAQGPDGAVGRVLAYSGATGTALWSASPAAQASLGSTLIAVADQDYDGVPDLIVSAGSPPVRSALVSGATGALVRSSDHTPAAIEALVSAGVRVFAASDLDGSGTVDAADALLFATAYSAADLDADLNGDGVLDAADVGLLADELATGVTTIDAFTADPNFGQPQPTSGGTPPAGCGCTEESSWEPIAQGSNPPPTFYDCVESSPNILWIDPPSGQPADSLTIGVVHPRPGCVLLTDESCAEVIAGPAGATADVSVSADGITFGTNTNGAYTVRVRIAYQCGDMICAMCRTFSFGVNVVPPLPDPTNCAPLVCIEGPGIQYEPQECEPLWLGDVPQMSLNARWVPFGETIWIAVRVLPEEDAGVIWTWGARAGCEGLVLETEEVIRGEGIFLLRVTTPPEPPTTCDHPHEFWVIAEGGYPGCPNTRSAGCLIRLGADGDGDGIVDEAEEDMQDGGNCPDPENPDSDYDGFGDGTEVRLRSDPCDPESVPDITGDTDNDGVTDFEEVEFYRTNPLHADSDDDGADDYGEIRVARALPELGMDPNQPLSVTRAAGVSNLADGAVAAYVAHDADRDGIFDELEIKRGWLATNPDQDFDGIRDGLELRHGMDPEQADQGPASPAAWIDSDGDGLTDAVERRLGTSRTSSDSDGNGVTDGWEAALGYDPTRADSDRNGTPDGDEDFDGDGISNRDELAAGTHLAVADSDGDGLCDSRDKNPTGTRLLPWPDLNADGAPDCVDDFYVRVLVGCTTPAGRAWAEGRGQRVASGRCPQPPYNDLRVRLGFGEEVTVTFGWTNVAGAGLGHGWVWGEDDTCQAIPDHVASSSVCSADNSTCTFSETYRRGFPSGSDSRSAIDSDGDGTLDTWDDSPGNDSFEPELIQTRVDLDIDSDNNDGLDEPAGTPAEEGLEDQPGHPGKIILADTWDSDGDNIPDNVDGLQGSSPPVDRFATTGLDLSRGNVRFVPMVLKIRGYFPNLDDPTAPPSVRFSYSFSDPSIPIVAGEDPFAVAPGNFRLWAKRRSVVRPPMLPGANNPFGADSMFPATPGAACGQDSGLTLLGGTAMNSSGVPETDQFGELLPGEAVPLKELGIGRYGGEVVVFVEAVAPSAQQGTVIRATVSGSQSVGAESGVDSVRATALAVRMLAYGGKALQPEVTRTVHQSNPEPRFEVDAGGTGFSVTGVEPVPGEPWRLHADLHVQGSLFDKASDIVRGQAGVPSNITVFINGERLALTTDDGRLPLDAIQKQLGPSPEANIADRMLRPYRFSAEFDSQSLLNDLGVVAGWNVLRLESTNVYRGQGYIELAFYIDVTGIPADSRRQIQVRPSALMSFDGRQTLAVPIGLDLRELVPPEADPGTVQWTSLVLDEHFGFASYRPTGSPVELSIANVPTLADAVAEPLDVELLDAWGDGRWEFYLNETAIDSDVFWGELDVTADRRPDWRGFGFAVTHVQVLSQSLGEACTAIFFALEGPGDVAALASKAVIGDTEGVVHPSELGYWVVCHEDDLVARAKLAISETVLHGLPPSVRHFAENPNQLNILDFNPAGPTPPPLSEELEYYRGLGEGLYRLGGEKISAVSGLFDDGRRAASHIWAEYLRPQRTEVAGSRWIPPLLLRLKQGENVLIEDDYKWLKSKGDGFMELSQTLNSGIEDLTVLAGARIAPSWFEHDKQLIEREYRDKFETIVPILEQFAREQADLTPHERGKVAAHVVMAYGEAMATAGVSALTAPARMARLAQVLSNAASPTRLALSQAIGAPRATQLANVVANIATRVAMMKGGDPSTLVRLLHLQKLRNRPGRGSWPALVEVIEDLRELNNAAGYPDASIPRSAAASAVLEGVKDAFREGAPPSVAEMRAALNFVPPAPGRPARYGFMFQMGLETNHCIPKQHLKEMLAVKKFGDRFDNLSPADKLWVNNKMEAVQDTMPAFPLKVNQHRVGMGEIRDGVRRRTFHEMSDGAWAATAQGDPDLGAMKQAIRRAYQEMDAEFGGEEAFDFESVVEHSLNWFDSIQMD